MPDTNENLIIAAGECSLTLLPNLGGKIASLRIGDLELLQSPLLPYAPRNPTMPFSESDASGWDECLPSVAECEIETEAGPAHIPAHIPDHGDLWRLPWQVLDVHPDSTTMRAVCDSLPLQLTRSMILTEAPSGWRLHLLYSLTNLGAYRVPWSWAAHPLFAADPGDRILLPDSIRELRLEGSRNQRLGVSGSQVSWPIAQLPKGGSTDLSMAHPANSGYGDKLFTGPLESGLASSPDSGWCSLARPSVGLQLTLRFDPVATPYLGLWLCYGGWPETPGPKQVCVALEPCTAPVDSLAEPGSWSRLLDPGETTNWPIELQIERIPA